MANVEFLPEETLEQCLRARREGLVRIEVLYQPKRVTDIPYLGKLGESTQVVDVSNPGR